MAKIETAWQIFALGILVTMLALFFLYIVLALFSRILKRTVGSGQRKSEDAAPPTGSRRPSQREAIPDQNRRDPRVMAAIAAAVHAYLTGYETESPRLTITPAEPSPVLGRKWGLAARKSLLEGRTEIENIRRSRLREKI